MTQKGDLGRPVSGARERLVELLRQGEPWPGAPAPEVIADRLLPVVEALADERAAEALEEAANEWQYGWKTYLNAGQMLRDRAASLRAASREETGR